MKLLSKRVLDIVPSATLAITAKAKKMKKEGIDVIGFGAGEPDFDTPYNIKDAAKKALDRGFTKYTPSSGTPELKEAIIDKFKNDNNLKYNPDEIVVSCGAKHSIFNAVFTICNEKDEVLLPAPYWVSYPEMIKAAGAVPVIIKTTEDKNFKITPHDLEKAIGKKTKLLILNSPSNPTGMLYNEDELEKIKKILVKAGIYCISDEIYEKIVYDKKEHVSIASLGEEIKNLTVVINGVSKSYAMTGWRIGYAAGPKAIIAGMGNLQSHSTSNPASIAQAASLEALKGPQDEMKKMISEFEKRRNYMVDRINSIKGLSTVKPDGAFYCFVNVSRLLEKVCGSSVKLADTLLNEMKVAVVPGIGFGDDNFIRLSYATSMKNIQKGLERIEEWVKKI